MQKKWRKKGIVALLAIVAVFAGSFASCSDDGEGSNENCEKNCVGQLAEEVVDCQEDAAACLQDCASLDDISCLWDCEDLEYECNSDFFMCLSSCSCLKQVQNCLQRCDLEDTDCLMDCSEVYVDCAGTDSPYMCANECEMDKSMCFYDCESEATDIPGYLACRDTCLDDYYPCLEDCA